MGVQASSIGIFDSGVGGLTVLRRVSEQLPAESIVYLGDTARVPYGTKSADTVIRYARSCARVLMARDIKLLVVACNTASAFAIEALREELDIPVLGVIDPGAMAAVQQTRNKRIGVIGTKGTVASKAYLKAIQAQDASTSVFMKACPLFVPLAEEGWTEGPVPHLIAESYLKELMAEQIDTLVLGCTHYPLLREVIGHIAGDTIRLVDSAEATACVVSDALSALDALAKPSKRPRYSFLVTDAPADFSRIGKRFLGYDIGHVEWVDF